jgi:hypothetical protein
LQKNLSKKFKPKRFKLLSISKIGPCHTCSVVTHFEASVRMKLTFPKVGIWSPLGLPKTQSLIAGVKTPCIEVLFISLKRSWSVDVQNGLTWTIWTFAA